VRELAKRGREAKCRMLKAESGMLDAECGGSENDD